MLTDDAHQEPLVRVAASVTLYNSSPSCIDAIATYRHQVERIYLIDNSEQPNSLLLTQLTSWPNVRYISQQGNQGVGAALNQAAQLAIADGFDFLLTMDDDTALPPEAVRTLLSAAASVAGRAGIVSGVHSPVNHAGASRPVLYTMTSGNLLDLSIYQRVGPFRADFFIDHLDHEYGLRLNKAGFQVLEIPGLRLQHQLGERKPSGWGTYQYTSHAPVRGYYIMRNGLIVAKLYPDFRRRAATLAIKEWLKALLFEDHKIQRLRLLWRGGVDAWRGRLGKYNP